MRTSALDQGTRSSAIIRGLVAAAAARSFSWTEELLNDTADPIERGDVVVVLPDGSIALADIENDPRPTGVALDTIDDGDTGQVRFGGPVRRVNVVSAVTAGQYGQTSTTPGRAQVTGVVARAFCLFTESGTTPNAFLWGGRGGGGLIAGLLIEQLSTDELDPTKFLHPDGLGGVEWTSDSASGGGMVPYYIPPTVEFEVPLNKQGLFSEPIEVDGILTVNGLLIGVD